MTAGMVAYKLCTRDYDCENCPLDVALRGADNEQGTSAEAESRTAPEAGEDESSPAALWEFPGDRRYHSCHSWVLPLGGHRVRCGVDAFAAHLLGQVTSVVFPTAASHVQQGGIACWFVDENELIPIRAPVPGAVVSVNHHIQSDPGLIALSPYDKGWLLEIDCPEPAGTNGELFPANEFRIRIATDLKRLHHKISLAMSHDAGVGPTLPDGGERLTDLHRILGSRRYHRLLLSFLK
jgi:glycine cleavage system H protein